ncbi:MAG: ABC transporter ATP-binding protein [Acidimicrobiales bacterium]|nr:ABC transporter ATP-binding protein [Acidimicrobiales bacterium]
MSEAIVIDRLSVTYGEVTVLSDVSARVPANQWTALLGRNGAGKSTLISAVVGVGPGGESVSFPLHEGPRATFCAYVPQNPVLPPGMTVAEYVLLGRTAHLGWLESEGPDDRERASRAICQLDLAPFAERYLSDLSGGEAQRAVLARALCQDAQILVLDEPTSSLDVGHQLEVLDLVKALALEEGLTVLSAVHDLTAAARYADAALILDGGRLVASGATSEVLNSELLSRHFDTPLHRMVGPDGSPVIIPLHTRPRRKEPTA